MQDFMFCAPTQIFFGKTAIDNLADSVKKYGKRVMLVYGGGSIKKMGLYDKVINILKENDLFYVEVSGVEPNPKMALVREGIQKARDNKIEVVLAVGGGSSIDTAKAIATGYYFDEDIANLIGKDWRGDVLPIITISTLSGAGTEMSTSSVLNNEDTQVKMGFHGPDVRPKVSLLNPEYTFSVPKNQTASGIADGMSHVIESYFSHIKGAYLHARLSEGLLKTFFKYGPVAYNEPENYEARANIMLACVWAINGLVVKGNYVMWSCHMLEHQLSAFYEEIPHGVGLAILTPRWMRWALNEERAFRYVDFGVNVLGIDPSLPDMEIANKAIEMLEDFFFNQLGIPSRLRDLGVTEDMLPKMAERLGKYPENLVNIMWKPMWEADALEIYKACF